MPFKPTTATFKENHPMLIYLRRLWSHWRELAEGSVCYALAWWAWVTGSDVTSGLLFAVGFVIFIFAGYLVWLEDRPKGKGRDWVGEWKGLATEFKNLPNANIEAELSAFSYHATGNAPPQKNREEWRIHGDGMLEGNLLCKKGGAMLVDSPNLSKEISQDVRNITDPRDRWLYYLKESLRLEFDSHGCGGTKRLGDAQVREDIASLFITGLGEVSSKVCLEIAGKEV